MKKALVNTAPSDFPAPSGITPGVEICANSGALSTVYCPEIKYETYLAGTEPTESCILHQPSMTFPNYDEPDPVFPDENLNPESFNQPEVNQNQPSSNVKRKRQVIVRICSESGMLATENCPQSQVMTEIFTEGEEPQEKCNVH